MESVSLYFYNGFYIFLAYVLLYFTVTAENDRFRNTFEQVKTKMASAADRRKQRKLARAQGAPYAIATRPRNAKQTKGDSVEKCDDSGSKDTDRCVEPSGIATLASLRNCKPMDVSVSTSNDALVAAINNTFTASDSFETASERLRETLDETEENFESSPQRTVHAVEDFPGLNHQDSSTTSPTDDAEKTPGGTPIDCCQPPPSGPSPIPNICPRRP